MGWKHWAYLDPFFGLRFSLKIHFTRKARIIDIYSAHIIKMYPNKTKPLCNSVHLVYDAQLFS